MLIWHRRCSLEIRDLYFVPSACNVVFGKRVMERRTILVINLRHGPVSTKSDSNTDGKWLHLTKRDFCRVCLSKLWHVRCDEIPHNHTPHFQLSTYFIVQHLISEMKMVKAVSSHHRHCFTAYIIIHLILALDPASGLTSTS